MMSLPLLKSTEREGRPTPLHVCQAFSSLSAPLFVRRLTGWSAGPQRSSGGAHARSDRPWSPQRSARSASPAPHDAGWVFVVLPEADLSQRFELAMCAATISGSSCLTDFPFQPLPSAPGGLPRLVRDARTHPVLSRSVSLRATISGPGAEATGLTSCPGPAPGSVTVSAVSRRNICT